MSTPTTGDISPEHTARAMNNDLHPEVKAAYAYVDRVSHTTADVQAAPSIRAWHGWALREAFLAGCSHAAPLSQPEPVAPADEELLEMASNALGYVHIRVDSKELEVDGEELIAFARSVWRLARYGTPASNTKGTH
jgi:hypothetical protein